MIGSVSSNPDVLYFEADTSATRLAGADVRYQPITGDGDANSIKEWENVTYLFAGVTTAATLLPTFSGTAYTARTIPASTDESRCRVTVPSNAGGGGSSKIAPGFTITANGTTQAWSLRGLTTRYEVVSDEESVR